jgi:hypothetical protein
MTEVSQWTTLFLESFKSFGAKFMGAVPSIIGAIVIFVIGYIIAILLSRAVTKILKITKFDALAEKVNATQYLEKANISISPSKLVGKFVYWILLLIVLITASETLGWDAVSNEISKLVAFIPKLFIAIVILILGTFIASFIRDLIEGATKSLGISTGKIIASIVFYLLFITIFLTALNQAGVDTSIITSNFLLILGTVLISAAISYGFASRDILSNILAGYFSRNMYTKGMKIEIEGTKGVIEGINNIGVVIKEESGDIVIIPTHHLINEKVRIIKS